MAARVRVGIAGTGSYLPDRVVSNTWFEEFLDTTDEWIVQRTGIRERRFAAEGELTSDMCVEAAKMALEDAGLTADDLDLIIVGTLTPDYPMPSTACLVQDKLGASRAGAFDVGAACTGFLTAMNTGEAFIAAGRAKHVLCIGAEILSRYIDKEDRGSCILFGDAAGAAILSPLEACNRGEILDTVLGADGSGFDFITIPAGGTAAPTTQATLDARDHYIHLKGRDVFRFAVSHMSALIRQLLEDYEPEDLGLILSAVRMGFPDIRQVPVLPPARVSQAVRPGLALEEALADADAIDDALEARLDFGHPNPSGTRSSGPWS